MKRIHWSMLLLGVAPLALGAAAPAPAASGQEAVCASMRDPGLFKDTTVTGVRWVPAAGGAPAFCEVTGKIKPVPGSSIGVVYRLPMSWNGKMLGLGGGGQAGNVRLQSAVPGLSKGYALAQTDGGHESADSSYKDWAVASPGKPNIEPVIDFGWRAVHEMTVVGKQVVQKYYGSAPQKSYFEGCSTGGRMALMEAQRFPDDYDGIIAGAPVYDFLTQTSAIFRTQFFHNDPESALTAGQVELVHKAALAACDAADGVSDGIITDPRTCNWDPGALQCRAGASGDTCLTPKQVTTVRNMYTGLKRSDGGIAAYPLSRGGEPEWVDRSIGDAKAPMGSNVPTGSATIQYIVFSDPKYDISKFTADAGVDQVMRSEAAKIYHANNPDISKFTGKGGKLILWHGFYDPGPSPLGTIRYYEAVGKTLGAGSDDKVRLFLAPGVYHCRGGPGPDQFDMVSAIDNWVTKSQAPTTVLATKANASLSRPLCPYPALPRYKGSGATNEAGSFVCK